MHDMSSKQIQLLYAATTHILESDITNRRFIASQSKADAERAIEYMHKASEFIRQATGDNLDPP